MISDIGDGLNILIACDYVPHHDWMSFFCWYSLSKNLPNAKVSIACHRKLMEHDLFSWTRKCKVPFILHKVTDNQGQVDVAINKGVQKPLLVISPESVCIRDFKEAGFSPNSLNEIQYLGKDLVCDCKDNSFCVFATYLNGCGNFVVSSWINKKSCPFAAQINFNQINLTANEIRIERLWTMATPLFKTVSRK